MQFCQTTGIIQTYACSPIDNSLCLIIKLVIALEDILQLVFWYAFSCICNRDFHILLATIIIRNRQYLFSLITGDYIKRHIYATASRSIFQGVRHQVANYLFQFVAICPGKKSILHSIAMNRHFLLSGIKLEIVTDSIKGINNIHFRNIEP